MYKVLISFTDDVDGGVYIAGKDSYPRGGVTPSEGRAAYLAGKNNRFKRPVITPIKEEALPATLAAGRGKKAGKPPLASSQEPL